MSLRKIAYKYSPSAVHPFIGRIEASDIASRMASGVFWSMAGAVISRGLMLVAYIIVARILGKEVYGEYGIVRSTVNMFMVFAGFGLGVTATKHVAEYRTSDPLRAGRIIAISGLFAMITGLLVIISILIFADVLATKTLNAPHLAGVLRIGAVILFFNALNGAQTGALAGFEAFKTIAWVNLGVGLASFPLIVGGAYFGDLTGAVWALCLNMGINWLLNHIALRKETKRFKVPFTYKDCFKEWPILWKFSLPAMMSGVMIAPVKWICDAILVNQPSGYGYMGMYTAGLAFQMMVLFAGNMVSTPLLSMLSNTGDQITDRFARINILMSWTMGVFAVVPLLCFPEIAELLFGKDFSGRQFRLTFSLILVFTCIIMYKQGLSRVLIANSLMWWGVFSNAVWAIILIISVCFFAKWGSVGLALSYLIAYTANTVVIMPVYHKKKLVPSGTLISKYTVVIWSVIVGLLALSYWQVPIGYRVICFCMALMILFFALRNIMQPDNK